MPYPLSSYWSFSFRLSIRSIRNFLLPKSWPSTIHCNLGILYFLRYRILGCKIVLVIVHSLYCKLCLHSIVDWCQIYIRYLLCARIFQRFLRSLVNLFLPKLPKKFEPYYMYFQHKIDNYSLKQMITIYKCIPLQGLQLPPQSTSVSSSFWRPSRQWGTINFFTKIIS